MFPAYNGIVSLAVDEVDGRPGAGAPRHDAAYWDNSGRANPVDEWTMSRASFAILAPVIAGAAAIAGCSAGTAAAREVFIKDFSSGADAVEARRRLAEARKDAEARRTASAPIPTVDIRKTCRTAAGASSASPTQQDVDACLKSEQDARDSIAQQWAEFTAADKAQCINPGVYLPSYVEWLTCLEMQRDVRKLRQQPTPSLDPAPTPRRR
jgi:hypothetical protein